MDKKQDRNKYIQMSKQVHDRDKASRHINFGLVAFSIIFAYLLFMIVLFGIKETVSYTTAEPGILLSSDTFSGLVLKQETVVKSPGAGVVNHLAPEGSKVKLHQPITVIDKDNAMSQLIEKNMANAAKSIDSGTIGEAEANPYLLSTLKNSVLNAGKKDFGSVYGAKRDIEKVVVDIQRSALLSGNPVAQQIAGSLATYEEALSENLLVSKTPVSGLVSYRMDGMEAIAYESFTVSDLTRKPSYTDSLARTDILEGEPLYKITDNYLWHLAAEVDSTGYEYLSRTLEEGSGFVNILLLESEIKIDVKVDKVWQENGSFYAIFTVDRLLNRFLQDRFLAFKVVYEAYEGIKIPNTAVVERLFLEIPEEALVASGRQSGVARQAQSAEAAGGMTQVFLKVPYYYTDDGKAYIPATDEIVPGLEISYVKEGETELSRYVLGTAVPLEGVYEINKGYAAFKIIETVYNQGSYRIIRDDTPFGTRPYDRIAIQGDSIAEAQIMQ